MAMGSLSLFYKFHTDHTISSQGLVGVLGTFFGHCMYGPKSGSERRSRANFFQTKPRRK